MNRFDQPLHVNELKKWAQVICVLLLVIGGPQLTIASSNIDSLLSVWNDASQSDSLRMKAMSEIAWKGYMNSKPDSAIFYAQLLFDFAEERADTSAMALALNTIGVAFFYQGNHTKAIEYYTRSLDYLTAANDLKGSASLLNNLASIYYNQGDYARAIQNLMRSLRIKEKMGDEFGVANALNNIGAIYRNEGDDEKALEHFEQSLELAEKEDALTMVATVLNSIGVIYKDRGDLAFAEGDSAAGNENFSRALVHYQRSLSIQEKLDDERGKAHTLNNIANLLYHQKDYAESLEYHRKSLEIKKQLNDQKGVAVSKNNMASIYRRLGEVDRAVELGQESLQIGEELGIASVQQDAAQFLYEAYSQMGNHREALRMHEKFIAMRDSISSKENQQEIMHQQFQYEFDKREALLAAEREKKDALAAEQLRRKHIERNGFIAGFGLMLLLAVVFFAQRMKISREKKRSDELLLNILPAETANELKSKGSSDAKLIDDVTVLFTDFKGFTRISEQMNPRELVQEINECFSAFDRITEKHGIEKIKTIGDAYMAAGGLPTPNNTHARDVVSAAMEIQQFMQNRSEERKKLGLPVFEIRIGIHSGPVVAGIVGIKKFQYDIWGDTVNTASRMESNGKAGKINISASTYQQVKDIFPCTYRGEIEVKGKGAVGMYFVEPIA